MSTRSKLLLAGCCLSFAASGAIVQTKEQCEAEENNTELQQEVIRQLDLYNGLVHTAGLMSRHQELRQSHNVGFASANRLTLYKNYLGDNSFNLRVNQLTDALEGQSGHPEDIFNPSIRERWLSQLLPPAGLRVAQAAAMRNRFGAFQFQGGLASLLKMIDPKLHTRFMERALRPVTYPLPVMQALYWMVVEFDLLPGHQGQGEMDELNPSLRLSNRVMNFVADGSEGIEWHEWSPQDKPNITFYCPYQTETQGFASSRNSAPLTAPARNSEVNVLEGDDLSTSESILSHRVIFDPEDFIKPESVTAL